MSFNNARDINQVFIIEPLEITGGTPIISACTTVYTNQIISCSGDSQIILTSGQTSFSDTITPLQDNVIDLGTTFTRFRNVNTVSGTSTVWTSTISLNSPNLNLGNDSNGNSRIITANNSIIQNDILDGNTY